MNYEKGGVYAERQESFPPARFVMLAKKNKQKSIEAGHEICEDKPHVEILKQGGHKVTFPVNDVFKNRYPRQWDAFQKGLEAPKTGMPLENYPGCTRAQCENLKRVNIFTVEELANASDTGLDAFGMGARDLQKKAKAYLSAALDNNAVVEKLSKLESRLEFLESENKELKGSNADMKVLLEEKKKLGRPKKE